MDFIAHGAYNVALQKTINRKQTKQKIFESFVWGMLPDVIAFGPAFIVSVFSGSLGHHTTVLGIDIVSVLYPITHSLIIFALVFGVVFLLDRRWYMPMLGWGMHILFDIPLHTPDFYPTPFLYPVSGFTVPFGVYWGNPIVWIASWIIVITWLIVLFLHNKKYD